SKLHPRCIHAQSATRLAREATAGTALRAFDDALRAALFALNMLAGARLVFPQLLSGALTPRTRVLPCSLARFARHRPALAARRASGAVLRRRTEGFVRIRERID